MFLDRKAENAKKKLELKEFKRKLWEEHLEREKSGVVSKKINGPDEFWPLEKKEDIAPKAPSSHGSESGSDDDLYTDAENVSEEDEPENDEEREERRIDAEQKERRMARKAKKAEALAAQAAEVAAQAAALAEAAGEAAGPPDTPRFIPQELQDQLGEVAEINRTLVGTTSPPLSERVGIQVNSVPAGSDINFPNSYPPGWVPPTEPVPELDHDADEE